MTKSFRQSIEQDQAHKRIQNLTREKEKSDKEVEVLRAKLEELKNVLSQSENENVSGFIDIEDVIIKNNRRSSYYDDEIDDLIRDISLNGQLQPVLLTSDNVLVAGHRRYNAVKKLETRLKAIWLGYNFYQIGQETFDRMQFAENEQRKNLDNFDISNLFNEYFEKGYTQVKIGELFNKSRSFVNQLIKIDDIDKTLVLLLKEIQHFGMTKEKFNLLNNQAVKPDSTIIGVKTLYKIAGFKTREFQNKYFISKFKACLTDRQLEQLGYIKPVKEVSFFKATKESFDKKIDSFIKNNPDKKDIADKVKFKISQALKELE